MGGGLIPISSIYSGVDIDKWGYLIKSLDPEEIERIVAIISLESNEELASLSVKSQEYIYANHLADNFKVNLKTILKKIIQCEDGLLILASERL